MCSSAQRRCSEELVVVRKVPRARKEKKLAKRREKKEKEGKKRGNERKTRPDTRPSVADGWAGAEMRVFPLFDSMVTDGPTDGRTKPLIELRVRN